MAVAVGLASTAFGQATSSVVGYVTEDLIPGFNPIGVTLHNNIVATGTFTGELVDAGADFVAALPDFAETTYLLEITSGDQSGAVAIIDSVTATELTLSSALGAGNADYQIRAAATLNDLFGGQLGSGVNSTSAGVDIVWVQRLDGTGFDQYFFSSIGNEFRLTTAAFAAPPAPISVFYPDAIFIEVTDSSSTTEVVIAGGVKTTGTVVTLDNGFNFVASPGPVGVTLGTSGFSDFLTEGLSAAVSDVVWLSDGAGGFIQYFSNNLASNPGWRLTTQAFGANQDDVELSSGMFIERLGESTAGVATLPDFFDAL